MGKNQSIVLKPNGKELQSRSKDLLRRQDVEGQQVILQDTFTKTTIALKKADRAEWGPPPRKMMIDLLFAKG